MLTPEVILIKCEYLKEILTPYYPNGALPRVLLQIEAPQLSELPATETFPTSKTFSFNKLLVGEDY